MPKKESEKKNLPVEPDAPPDEVLREMMKKELLKKVENKIRENDPVVMNTIRQLLGSSSDETKK